ncbi:MAG: 3'-5' exonuclease [Verrucomicrobia bacterium]|nr:3'-5' exonuclease [Verrucomicrobiota bacterium]
MPSSAGIIQDLSFAAIDFESAGAARGVTDTPIQIGIAQWSPQECFSAMFDSYLHTQQEITWAAQKQHGIGPAELKDAPPLVSLWPQVKHHLHDRVLVAHGKGTEKKFLRAFPGHGFGPWVDTLLLARAVWPQEREHSLGHLCRELALTEKISALVPDRTWHDALYDAVASLCLLEWMIVHLDLAHLLLESLLQPDQSVWHLKKNP